jgi:hypothetical protein
MWLAAPCQGSGLSKIRVAKPATRNGLVPQPAHDSLVAPKAPMADLLCPCLTDKAADEVEDAPISLGWSDTLKSTKISSSR